VNSSGIKYDLQYFSIKIYLITNGIKFISTVFHTEPNISSDFFWSQISSDFALLQIGAHFSAWRLL